MSKSQSTNRVQQTKAVQKLEAQISTLNKAVAALPPLCDCEAKYTHEEELALAETLAGLWEQQFQQELETGIRASMDHMDPSKAAARD